MEKAVTDGERPALQRRPGGRPLMHQSWGKLLFMHWRVKPELLRPLLPPRLELDSFDGSAWIALVPFTMWNTRAHFLPPLPGLRAMHELNVRTYVHFDGVPGVWFFSLDCTSAAAVLGARTFYFLPYYTAKMTLQQEEQTIQYTSQRTAKPVAGFKATWSIGESLPTSTLGSLEYFLTERYCLYSERRGSLYRAQIFHQPWPLRQAAVTSLDSNMIEALGLPEPNGAPLLHYAEALDVDIWPLRKL